MAEGIAGEGWGINWLQAGIAAVLMVFATGLVVVMNRSVPDRETIAANAAVFRFDVVYDGVELRSRGTVLPVGAQLALRVGASQGGNFLLYRSDGEGTNLGVWPGGFESTALEPGDRDLPPLSLDRPGHWFITAILCDDAFELDPKKPKASWSCKLREMDFVVQ
ncbi:MAG: hypothetical protein H6737_21340 [Alphaproteobacteria bacterium]|nr:hypothetical protein [Alphaproteobacteria bacterium]